VVAVRAGRHGVRAADLAEQRAALVAFAEEMYAPLVRCDQRAKGEQYVRGWLLEGRRKSIQPMAPRLPDGDEEGLQQFIAPAYALVPSSTSKRSSCSGCTCAPRTRPSAASSTRSRAARRRCAGT
jgi:hypothetical protein